MQHFLCALVDGVLHAEKPQNGEKKKKKKKKRRRT
jgi:hypothetical protein